MKKFTVDGKEYKLEYSFEAALDNDCVQNMFNMLTGAYVYKSLPNGEQVSENQGVVAAVEGFSRMFADTPRVCISAFRAGLKENHPDVAEDEAKELMKRYMKNKKLGFNDLFNEIVECMEKDGFFKLTNLTEVLERIGNQASGQTENQTANQQN